MQVGRPLLLAVQQDRLAVGNQKEIVHVFALGGEERRPDAAPVARFGNVVRNDALEEVDPVGAGNAQHRSVVGDMVSGHTRRAHSGFRLLLSKCDERAINALPGLPALRLWRSFGGAGRLPCV